MLDVPIVVVPLTETVPLAAVNDPLPLRVAIDAELPKNVVVPSPSVTVLKLVVPVRVRLPLVTFSAPLPVMAVSMFDEPPPDISNVKLLTNVDGVGVQVHWI